MLRNEWDDFKYENLIIRPWNCYSFDRFSFFPLACSDFIVCHCSIFERFFSISLRWYTASMYCKSIFLWHTPHKIDPPILWGCAHKPKWYIIKKLSKHLIKPIKWNFGSRIWTSSANTIYLFFSFGINGKSESNLTIPGKIVTIYAILFINAYFLFVLIHLLNLIPIHDPELEHCNKLKSEVKLAVRNVNFTTL